MSDGLTVGVTLDATGFALNARANTRCSKLKHNWAVSSSKHPKRGSHGHHPGPCKNIHCCGTALAFSLVVLCICPGHAELVAFQLFGIRRRDRHWSRPIHVTRLVNPAGGTCHNAVGLRSTASPLKALLLVELGECLQCLSTPCTSRRACEAV